MVEDPELRKKSYIYDPPPEPGIYEMREYEPTRCYHLTAGDLAERALGWFCLGTMAGAVLMRWVT